MRDATEYLDFEDLVAIAMVANHAAPHDPGLLASATARPRAQVSGRDVYPDLYLKAAALLHSIVTDRSLNARNEGTAVTAAMTFLDLNGHPASMPVDADAMVRLAFDAADRDVELTDLAATLRTFTD